MNSMTYDETKQYELDRRYIRKAAIWTDNTFRERCEEGALHLYDSVP